MAELNEDVLNEDVNELNEEVLNEDEEVLKEEQQAKSTTFNPESIEFDTDYNFSGYDLSEWKDSIEENEESLAALESYTAKFQELGLSQEQVKGLVGFMVESGSQVDTPESIKKELNKQLTYEEKKAYKANCNLLSQALKGTPEEPYFNSVVSNPWAVKVLSKVIGHLKGGQSVSGVKVRETRTNAGLLTAQQGFDVLEEFMTKSQQTEESIEAKKKEIRGKLLNQEEADYFNEIYGK